MATPTPAQLLQEAIRAEEAGQFARAEQMLAIFVQQQPKDAKGLMRLVRLRLRHLHKPDQALALVPRMLKLAPNAGLSHELAAEAHCAMRNYDIALAHAEKAVKLQPKSADTLYVAATVYQYAGQYDASIRTIRKALAIRPDHLPSKMLLIWSLNADGQQREAEELCRAVFAAYPNNLPNLTLWSRITKATPEDPIYLHLRDTVLPALDGVKDRRKAEVLKTLGKAENDIGNYAQAFRHFAAAKQLATVKYDRSINRNFVNGLMGGSSRSDFFGASGHDSERPLLIVGMPRTGSTLLEQVLSNHPQIGGIGESEILRRLANAAGFRFGDGAGFAQTVRKLTPERAAQYADLYLQQSGKIAPGNLRIVDKNLHNFELLGFFARLFPKARIIRALRDPMDNCVSCYMQPLNDFHSYTHDLRNLGEYYTDFRRLTDHWKTVIPNPMMDVSYEDMVADTEGMARKIIDFIGLDWDPACLDFQNNSARVRTLSVAQVRQPIYKSSVKRWKRYEEFLDPLKAELKQFYPDGFDA